MTIQNPIGERCLLARGADQVATVPILRSAVGLIRAIVALVSLMLVGLGEAFNKFSDLKHAESLERWGKRCIEEVDQGVFETITWSPESPQAKLHQCGGRYYCKNPKWNGYGGTEKPFAYSDSPQSLSN